MRERTPANTMETLASEYLSEAKNVYEESAREIRLAQLVIAERCYRDTLAAGGETDNQLPDGSPSTFAHFVELLTPIAVAHDRSGDIDATFTPAERDKINNAYQLGGLDATRSYLDSLMPPLDGMEHYQISHHEEDVVFTAGRYTVFEQKMIESSETFPSLKEGARYLVIDIAPPYIHRTEGEMPPQSNDNDAVFELPKLMRRVAEEAQTRNIKGILVDSWILDAFPEGNNFGFEIVDFFEKRSGSTLLANLRYPPSWQQLLRHDGTIDDARMRQTLKECKLPYTTKEGFMPKQVLLDKYLRSNAPLEGE